MEHAGSVTMARKSWSNFFLFMAALNLALAMTPRNPIRMIDWVVIPCCLTLGVWVRKRMI